MIGSDGSTAFSAPLTPVCRPAAGPIGQYGRYDVAAQLANARITEIIKNDHTAWPEHLVQKEEVSERVIKRMHSINKRKVGLDALLKQTREASERELSMEIYDAIEAGTLKIEQPYSFVATVWTLVPGPQLIGVDDDVALSSHVGKRFADEQARDPVSASDLDTTLGFQLANHVLNEFPLSLINVRVELTKLTVNRPNFARRKIPQAPDAF
jgi:hypothetical protein